MKLYCLIKSCHPKSWGFEKNHQVAPDAGWNPQSCLKLVMCQRLLILPLFNTLCNSEHVQLVCTDIDRRISTDVCQDAVVISTLRLPRLMGKGCMFSCKPPSPPSWGTHTWFLTLRLFYVPSSKCFPGLKTHLFITEPDIAWEKQPKGQKMAKCLDLCCVSGNVRVILTL